MIEHYRLPDDEQKLLSRLVHAFMRAFQRSVMGNLEEEDHIQGIAIKMFDQICFLSVELREVALRSITLRQIEDRYPQKIDAEAKALLNPQYNAKESSSASCYARAFTFLNFLVDLRLLFKKHRKMITTDNIHCVECIENFFFDLKIKFKNGADLFVDKTSAYVARIDFEQLNISGSEKAIIAKKIAYLKNELELIRQHNVKELLKKFTQIIKFREFNELQLEWLGFLPHDINNVMLLSSTLILVAMKKDLDLPISLDDIKVKALQELHINYLGPVFLEIPLVTLLASSLNTAEPSNNLQPIKPSLRI